MAPFTLGLARITVRPLRDFELEPCPLVILAGLPDGDSCDGKDLLHQEEPETGIPAKTLGEDIVLVKGGDPHAVVLNTDRHIAIRGFRCGDPDQGHCSTVLERIFDKIVKSPFQQGIGKDLQLSGV